MYKDKIKNIRRRLETLPGAGSNVCKNLQSELANTDNILLVGSLIGKYLDLELVGCGATRAVYKLDNQAVVKVTIGYSGEDMGCQSELELLCLAYAIYHTIPYAPTLLYFEEDYIVLPYYEEILTNSPEHLKLIANAVDKLTTLGFEFLCNDISNPENWAFNTTGQLSLLDWGTVRLPEKFEDEAYTILSHFNEDNTISKSDTFSLNVHPFLIQSK